MHLVVVVVLVDEVEVIEEEEAVEEEDLEQGAEDVVVCTCVLFDFLI